MMEAWGASPGRAPALFAFLLPLSPGMRIIRYRGSEIYPSKSMSLGDSMVVFDEQILENSHGMNVLVARRETKV